MRNAHERNSTGTNEKLCPNFASLKRTEQDALVTSRIKLVEGWGRKYSSMLNALNLIRSD
jgi:hypothetical protein